MKYKIIALCGEAATGKDTLKNKVLEKYPNQFHRVVTATTRPPREGEVNGKDYHFLTKEEFGNLEMIEATVFNNWHYGTPVSSLSKDKINLLVLNPSGIYNLIQEPDKYDVHVVRLKADDKTRMLRQLNRESDPNVDEIVRRYKTDKDDFAIFDANLYDKIDILDTELMSINELVGAVWGIVAADM